MRVSEILEHFFSHLLVYGVVASLGVGGMIATWTTKILLGRAFRGEVRAAKDEAQTAREEVQKIQSEVKQRFLSLEEDRKRAGRRTDDLYSALINIKMNTYIGSSPAPQMLDGDVTRILTLSQAEYDALPEKDDGTMYLIPELKK